MTGIRETSYHFYSANGASWMRPVGCPWIRTSRFLCKQMFAVLASFTNSELDPSVIDACGTGRKQASNAGCFARRMPTSDEPALPKQVSRTTTCTSQKLKSRRYLLALTSVDRPLSASHRSIPHHPLHPSAGCERQRRTAAHISAQLQTK